MIVRLTKKEEARVKALCNTAWNAFLKNKTLRLWVTSEDLTLLIKAGGILKYHHQITVPGKGKNKKPRKVWQAEVLYPDDNGHTFYHEERKWFFVPKPRRPRPFP